MGIKLGIKDVELSGIKYPVAFNMLALEEFCDEEGVGLAGIEDYLRSENGSMKKIFKLFTAMMNYGAKRSGLEVVYTVEDVADLVGFDIEPVTAVMAKFFPDEDSAKKPEVSPSSSKKKSVTRKKRTA